MKKQILVIAEQREGILQPITHELIACARALNSLSLMDIRILISGLDVGTVSEKLARSTGLDVTAIPAESKGDDGHRVYKNLPEKLISELNPAFILIAHSPLGLDIAPALAARLNAACITGVEKINRCPEGICFSRGVFNDKILSVLIPETPVTVLTIQPGKFRPEVLPGARPGQVSVLKIFDLSGRSRFIGYKSKETDTSALDEAAVLVSAGNGIGKKENLDLIYRLARVFPKSAVAGSRPVCDKKWLPYRHQVGATGARVKPKLYIACGISGASQHVAGMLDAGFIVAVNTDPRAAIFNISDVCIVEEIESFIPLFIETYQNAAKQALNENPQKIA